MSEPGRRHTLVKVLTGEERGLQKLDIEPRDNACFGCWLPDSIDDEHASPENSPMGETQADKGNHDVFLPLPKRDSV